MAKILFRKGKREQISENEIYVEKQQQYLVQDTTSDFHCKEGFISKKELMKDDGKRVKTNTKKEFLIFSAGFIDSYRKIKRSAQIISLKDIGAIMAFTGVNKESRVVDAGAGSGALACYLAHICKEVTTYEIRKDFYDITKENMEKLNLHNIKIKQKNVHDGISERDVDLITLDLPDPWNAIPAVKKSLKTGGFLVSYSPTIPQVMDMVNAVGKRDDFAHLLTMELIKREWEIEDRKVRPVTTQNVHTGFLSFFRKLQK